jgi:hypothetical protein
MPDLPHGDDIEREPELTRHLVGDHDAPACERHHDAVDVTSGAESAGERLSSLTAVTEASQILHLSQADYPPDAIIPLRGCSRIRLR